MTKANPSNCSRMISWPKIKKVTGYVVFSVEKGKTSELQYERKTYSTDKKSKPLKITIDSSKYEDKVEASTLLADKYINQVFFSGQRKIKKDADFVLGTDLKKERSDFCELTSLRNYMITNSQKKR